MRFQDKLNSYSPTTRKDRYARLVALKDIPQGQSVAVNQSRFSVNTQSREMIESQETTAIAVMGATGSGKTTFINLASNSKLRVGRGLQSCTNSVQLAQPFELDGHMVTLIDTPGFDDTTRSDADILNMVAAFLATTYEHGKKLAGVIYLHRISDVRMGGISTRNFRMFRELCGEGTLKNVVIVTNMWGEVGQEVGEAREAELACEDKFFKPVLDKGGQLLRHDNTVESAQAILRRLTGNQPLPLCIQRELVDQHKDLSQTAAGEELNRELMAQIRKHKAEMKALEEEMKEAIRARDEETRKELEIGTKKLQVEMMKVQSDAQKLATDYSEQKARLERNVEQARCKAVEAEENQRRQIQELQSQLQQTTAASNAERESLQRKLDEALKRYNERPGGVFCNIGRALDSIFGF